jgi:hypothetical protein
MVETHEKWGQWAMGQYGNTPEFGVEERCGKHYDDVITSSAVNLSLNESMVEKLRSSRNAICNSTRVNVTAGMELTDGLVNSSGYLTWMPSRGKCVKYRQEGESCIQMQNRMVFQRHVHEARIGGWWQVRWWWVVGPASRLCTRACVHWTRLRSAAFYVRKGTPSKSVLRWSMVGQ